VGHQAAARLLLGSQRLTGQEAFDLGLADRLVEDDEQLRDAAFDVAGILAAQAPLAVASVRSTLREGLAQAVELALPHELAEQGRLWATDDAAEGIRASLEHRDPVFRGV
jgi:enoyl-CoA hydratase/carnithine racemase